MRNWIFATAMVVAFASHAAPPDWVAAKVVKAEPDRSRVTLDHERIGSIGMEAMVMPFKVGNKVDLKRFQKGDRVRFTVSSRDGHLIVDEMERSQ